MPLATLPVLGTTAAAQRAVPSRVPCLRRFAITAGAGRVPDSAPSRAPPSSSDLRQLRGVGRTYEALLSAHAIDSIAALQDLYHTSLGASKDELQRFLAVSCGRVDLLGALPVACGDGKARCVAMCWLGCAEYVMV